ncbi:two-component system regulatory protein YycI [Salimicrobium halophilum]|uniref:Two-component signal transduction system YycFG, regulatory protein YycI n=1 Tax=Salimicrobium halophilum TaxID=86666 RepID=A0A1G8USX5_9BACI|nr:two-component system regulatory protein YycI [Salimicrobium halophilum]SDJ56942.1 Two-component signal transduction system YycFG, regulatory protein YycI [Salimicrobium halophilum]
MQWGQIKTLFIISFLLLDLFLLMQLWANRESEVIQEVSETTLEEELNTQNIDISEVPTEAPNVSFLTANPGGFSDQQLEGFQDKGNQQVNVFNDRLLVSTLDDPVEIDKENIQEEISEIVPFSNRYSYWGWDEEESTALFFQKANNRTIYYNRGGLLMIRTENGEITGYTATLLEIPDQESEEMQQDLISPMDIVSLLYNNGYLEENDKIEDMTVGYYSLVNLEPGQENGSQVFAPTWRVRVGGDFYFVHATNGQILTNDAGDFIERVTEAYASQLSSSTPEPVEQQEEETEE